MMLSPYDMQCLSRLEDRWLDPDYNTIPEDEEDDELDWLRADDEAEERFCESLMGRG